MENIRISFDDDLSEANFLRVIRPFFCPLKGKMTSSDDVMPSSCCILAISSLQSLSLCPTDKVIVAGGAVQTHLSVSASTIREMTLHSGLSTFLIWTATFPPIQLTVFIYLNW